MKNSNLINCESVSYESEISNIDFVLSESSLEDIQYLQDLGFRLIIEKGKVYVEGSDIEVAKLLKGEIEDWLINQSEYYELNDYVRFKMWSDDVFVNDIVLSIKEVKTEKPYNPTILDVLEYIIDYWVLSDKEKDALKKEDTEYYQEMRERSYQ